MRNPRHPKPVILAAAAIVAVAGGAFPAPAAAIGGGAGVGTPGPIVFIRDDNSWPDTKPQRLWTVTPGGTPVVVPNSENAWNARWSPDGRVIAYGIWNEGVYLINPDGSGKRRLFTPAEGETFGTPTWSPDGTHLAFTTHNNSGDGHIEIADSLDGARQVVATGSTRSSTGPRTAGSGAA